MHRWTPPTQIELHAGIEAMAAQGQGVWLLELFHVSVLPELLALQAEALTTEQWETLQCFRMMSQAVEAATKAEPRLCLTCDAGFDRKCFPTAIVIMRPDVPHTSARLVQGLCRVCCGRDEAALQAAVLSAFGRYTGQSDLRVIQPHPEHRA